MSLILLNVSNDAGPNIVKKVEYIRFITELSSQDNVIRARSVFNIPDALSLEAFNESRDFRLGGSRFQLIFVLSSKGRNQSTVG